MGGIQTQRGSLTHVPFLREPRVQREWHTSVFTPKSRHLVEGQMWEGSEGLRFLYKNRACREREDMSLGTETREEGEKGQLNGVRPLRGKQSLLGNHSMSESQVTASPLTTCERRNKTPL